MWDRAPRLANPKRYGLLGLPGSGKTFLTQKIQEILLAHPHPGEEIQFISYGSVMAQIVAEKGLTRDQMRDLPLHEQLAIGIKAAGKIAALPGRYIIVDTHALVKARGAFVPGFAPKVYRQLAPQGLIFIDVAPSILLKRRAQDPLRVRNAEDLPALHLHRTVSLSYVAALAAHYGTPFAVIPNDADGQASAQKMLDFIFHERLTHLIG